MSSVNDMTDHLFISLSIICGTVKGVNVYVCRNKIQQIFNLHEGMLARCVNNHRRFSQIRAQNKLVFKYFIFMYMGAWVFVGLYNIISVREKRFWPSTHHLDFDWANGEWLYWTVFIYQAAANFCFCGWHAVQDTLPIVLILILCGHIEVLEERFRGLGTELAARSERSSCTASHRVHHDRLKECCIYYDHCLRWVFFNHVNVKTMMKKVVLTPNLHNWIYRKYVRTTDTIFSVTH